LYEKLLFKGARMPDPKNPRASREPLLTAAAVAERLHVSLRSVRRLLADGRLPFVRIGRSVRVRPEALEDMIEGK
jgi:excisionase family DNA binding protein